jgi:hypothetical protein
MGQRTVGSRRRSMVAGDKVWVTGSGQTVESIHEEFPSLPIAEATLFPQERTSPDRAQIPPLSPGRVRASLTLKLMCGSLGT